MDDSTPIQRRRVHLLVAGVVIAGGLAAAGMIARTGEAAGPFVSGIAVGDCFSYPGDGVEFVRLDVVACSDVHYGEVYGTVWSGDTNDCVDQFEDYTGEGNYWATDWIIGFLPIDAERSYCYAYAAVDTAGSISIHR